MNKLYGYKKCSTVNKLIKYLRKQRITYEYFDLIDNDIDRVTLEELITKSGKSIDDFFNIRGKYFKEHNKVDDLKTMSYEEKLSLLLSNGFMIKRPILEMDDHVFIKFSERDLEIFLLK
ncbi:MAG: Spx/MgsR family RNA polymerase-binding regulatory protein [Bacilli bacterium]|jgi:arsenate reductase|nr:Spx/MgsR family RNA polymerase-binding regulatory protein [Bacilli bacterium]